MKVWLCFLRKGKTEDPQRDILFATTERSRWEKFFEGPEFEDPEWRRYAFEITFRLKEQLSPGEVLDYVYRGGPGV